MIGVGALVAGGLVLVGAVAAGTLGPSLHLRRAGVAGRAAGRREADGPDGSRPATNPTEARRTAGPSWFVPPAA